MAHRVEPQLHRLPPTHTEKTVHEENEHVTPRSIEARSWLDKLVGWGSKETPIPGMANGIERVHSVEVPGSAGLIEIRRECIRKAGGRVKTDQLLGITRVVCEAASGRVREYRRETPQGQPLRVVQANDVGWRDEVYVYDVARDDDGRNAISGRLQRRTVEQLDTNNELVWTGTVTQEAGSEVETRQSKADKFGYAETGLLFACNRAVIRRTTSTESGGTRVIEDVMGYDPKLSRFASPNSGHVRVNREILFVNGTIQEEKTIESVGEEKVIPAEYDKFTNRKIKNELRYVRYNKKRETQLKAQFNEMGRITETQHSERNFSDTGEETHGLDTTTTFTETGLPKTVIMKHRTMAGTEVTTKSEYAYSRNRLVELVETDTTGKVKRYRRPAPGTKISTGREHPIESGLMLVE